MSGVLNFDIINDYTDVLTAFKIWSNFLLNHWWVMIISFIITIVGLIELNKRK